MHDLPVSKIKQLVIEVADEEIIPRFQRIDFNYKSDGSFITETDLAVQQRLQTQLQALTPHIPFLGEEMSTAEQQQLIENSDSGLWCLDPLDGTSNYASGLPFFAVSLALLKDKKPVFGLVYDPMRGECFMAEQGKGAWLNDQTLQCKDDQRPMDKTIAVVDFKRLTPALRNKLNQQPPYSSQRSLGSVALDWCWLAANRYHLYVHGKQKAWDYAAGWLVLAEAGGHSSTLEGNSVADGSLAAQSAVASNSSRLYSEWYQFLSTP